MSEAGWCREFSRSLQLAPAETFARKHEIYEVWFDVAMRLFAIKGRIIAGESKRRRHRSGKTSARDERRETDDRSLYAVERHRGG